MSRAPKTLMEHVYVRTGSFSETGRVTTLILEWAAAQDQLGSVDLLAEDYIAWAEPETSRRTVERQLQAFRAAFPGHRNPNRIAAEVNKIAAEKKAERKPLLALPETLLTI